MYSLYDVTHIFHRSVAKFYWHYGPLLKFNSYLHKLVILTAIQKLKNKIFLNLRYQEIRTRQEATPLLFNIVISIKKKKKL